MFNFSDMKGTELLLIDGLVKSCGQELGAVWKREGGNGLYPPPSFHVRIKYNYNHQLLGFMMQVFSTPLY